jgi:hypothetical protein
VLIEECLILPVSVAPPGKSRLTVIPEEAKSCAIMCERASVPPRRAIWDKPFAAHCFVIEADIDDSSAVILQKMRNDLFSDKKITRQIRVD